jgi:L-seryl-tRNA(Ser) seleniumtransferase
MVVERFVKLDHAAEWKEWERRIGAIEKALADVPTLLCERIVPPIANHVPHLILAWDEKHLNVTREQVTRGLAKGKPPIQIGRVAGTGDKGILISVLTLQVDEDRIVADRLRALLKRR